MTLVHTFLALGKLPPALAYHKFVAGHTTLVVRHAAARLSKHPLCSRPRFRTFPPNLLDRTAILRCVLLVQRGAPVKVPASTTVIHARRSVSVTGLRYWPMLTVARRLSMYG